MQKTKGVMLINLGTPDTYAVGDVRRYLREFLSDPRVIDIPALIRYILVYLIIAPFRSPKSAAMYKKIWLKNGKSPLLFYSENLTKKLADHMGEEFSVKLAMRYGKPSIKSVLESFRDEGVSSIKVAPLFPQYAMATFESATEKVKDVAKAIGFEGEFDYTQAYYNEDGFIDAEAEKVRPSLEKENPDHVVMTFHGLPVRHCRKTEILEKGEKSRCGQSGCCDVLEKRNMNCYRAQCVETGRLIASKLGLDKEDYTVTFQSRFGKDPWIEPYTDKYLDHLKELGKKKVMVISPSFATDCLETLEEVGIGLKEDFEEGAGERSLIVEPCLNDDDRFCSYLAKRLSY